MKTCNKCKVEKEFSEFYRKINRGDGLAGYSSRCKQCIRKRLIVFQITRSG